MLSSTRSLIMKIREWVLELALEQLLMLQLKTLRFLTQNRTQLQILHLCQFRAKIIKYC